MDLKIMSDFDSTLINENSLNIFTKNILIYYFKNWKFGLIISSLPVLIVRLKELFSRKKLLADMLIFDNSDLVIRKTRRLRGVPYKLYLDTLPYLTINKKWIIECLKYKNKYNIKGRITIVSRNGIDEIKEFFNYKSSQNNELLKDKAFIQKIKTLTKNKITYKKDLQNKDVLKQFGIEFQVIANNFTKKKVLVDNKPQLVYSGIVESMSDIGFIDRQNKTKLYSNNLVLADREEKMYRTWAKDFKCVQ